MIWTGIEWTAVGLIASSKLVIGRKKWWGWGVAFVGYNLALVKFVHVGFWGFAANMIFMVALSLWYARSWYREENGD